MKILVTGGGGFIGSALIRELVRKGYEVSSFSRKLYPEHQKFGIRIYQGDIADPKAVESACLGIDVVFHMAAKVAMWGPYDEFTRTNVDGTNNLVTKCIKCNVKRLIFTSSASVVFDGFDLNNVDETADYPQKPVSAYTATKAIAEQLVLRANSKELSTIALRPHLVWGPGDSQLISGILNHARSGKLKKIGREDFLIDTTYIENYIDALLLTMEVMENKPEVCGKAYFITNGEPIFIWNFINAILLSFGLNPVKKIIPKTIAILLAVIIEKVYLVFNLKSEPYISRIIVNELSSNHWFDITMAKEKLGYSPRINNEKGFELLRSSITSEPIDEI